MLLRVAAVAGAGAFAGACSSSSTAGSIPLAGSIGIADTDSGADAEGHPGCANGCGSIAVPPADASSDAGDGDPQNYCLTHVCGAVDAGPPPEGGADADASLPCGTGVCGSIVMPQDAAPDTGDAAHD